MIRLVSLSGDRYSLRWTDQRPESAHGLGVLLFARDSAALTGQQFGDLAAHGWRIECDDARELRRAAGALAWGRAGLPRGSLMVRPAV